MNKNTIHLSIKKYVLLYLVLTFLAFICAFDTSVKLPKEVFDSFIIQIIIITGIILYKFYDFKFGGIYFSSATLGLLYLFNPDILNEFFMETEHGFLFGVCLTMFYLLSTRVQQLGDSEVQSEVPNPNKSMLILTKRTRKRIWIVIMFFCIPLLTFVIWNCFFGNNPNLRVGFFVSFGLLWILIDGYKLFFKKSKVQKVQKMPKVSPITIEQIDRQLWSRAVILCIPLLTYVVLKNFLGDNGDLGTGIFFSIGLFWMLMRSYKLFRNDLCLNDQTHK